MSTRSLGVDRSGHVHPSHRFQYPDRKVKPQVTTQIAHPRARGGSAPGVDTSTPVHPRDATPTPTRVQPVRAAIAARKEEA
jgi:hypothetical protein